MKMFKADAELYVGKREEALEVYSSFSEDLDKPEESEVCWEYVGRQNSKHTTCNIEYIVHKSLRFVRTILTFNLLL